MEAALYGPGGYYAERPSLGGAGGDYFTAPELHPAFGALLGRQVAEVWKAFGRPGRFDVVEHGPGSGALCRDLLLWAAHDTPDFAAAVRYTLVERSRPLRETQRAALTTAGLLDGRIEWANPSPGPIAGVILANELLDALPTHLVAVRDGRLLERYVAPDQTGAGLTFVEAAPSTPALAAYFEALDLLPGEGCLAEVNLGAVTWIEQASASLERGALLVLDYGYPAAELYAPHRRHGTLLTYQGHALGSDPLVWVGQQDITSHVDFTSIARAGERGGIETVGLVDQATFLHNLGLRQYLRLLDQARLSAQEYDANSRALLELVNRDGLGAIKVLIQTRGLPGFQPTGLGTSDGPPYPAKLGGVGGAVATNSAWLPLLHPGQMRLPGPLEAEGFADLEAQWRDFWTGEEDS